VRLEEATETLYNIPAAGKTKNLLTIEIKMPRNEEQIYVAGGRASTVLLIKRRKNPN